MHLSLLPDWANTTERDTTILHLLSFRVNPIQKPVRTGQYGGGEEQEMLTYGPESYVPGDRCPLFHGQMKKSFERGKHFKS